MKNFDKYVMVFLLSGLVYLPLAIWLSVGNVDAIMNQAIERGYALYCPTRGNWAWTGECVD